MTADTAKKESEFSVAAVRKRYDGWIKLNIKAAAASNAINIFQRQFSGITIVRWHRSFDL